MNAAEFNSRYPVGTPVLAYPGCRPEDCPNDRRVITRTRSKAQVLGGHTDVVWVDGHSACVALSHVDVVAEVEWEAAKAADADRSRAAGFMRGYVRAAGPATPSDISLLRAALFAHLTPDGAGTEADFPEFAALLDEYVNACTEQLRLQLAQEAVR